MVRDESSDSYSTGILNYLIRVLSKAKSAREWQLILGKALTEKFSDLSSLPDQTSHGELRAETPVGITMLKSVLRPLHKSSRCLTIDRRFC